MPGEYQSREVTCDRRMDKRASLQYLGQRGQIKSAMEYNLSRHQIMLFGYTLEEYHKEFCSSLSESEIEEIPLMAEECKPNTRLSSSRSCCNRMTEVLGSKFLLKMIITNIAWLQKTKR
jgi:hypothetical protein